MTTLRVSSKPGRLTRAEHVFVIVRNLVNAQAADAVGRVRMLPKDAEGLVVRLLACGQAVCCVRSCVAVLDAPARHAVSTQACVLTCA